MKSERQEKILEIIRENDIATQEELLDVLRLEGYEATQATISRDIRELRLTKIVDGGIQKYAAPEQDLHDVNERYLRVLREGYVSVDGAGNILIINTVSGMAMAVAAAIDSIGIPEIAGTIAGDDTIFCAIRDVDKMEYMKNLISSMV
ncbi:MAG: arginine repressor [Catonella sp.]|nr:arginine repressor [Catonella sp.]MDY6355697.1 arginine repressor [Catonella sp.]